MATQVTELLGGERVLGTSVHSNLDLARATREGLPAAAAMQVGELLLCYEPAFATDVHATLLPEMRHLVSLVDVYRGLRWPSEGREAGPIGRYPRLTPEESDIVVRMAGTLAKAIDTLGDRTRAVHWLSTPNPVLGGEIPARLLDTSAGTGEVEAILERIEFGVYS